MIQIQELIKHFVLGIASLIICSITMAEIKNTKDFMKAIEEVRQEYPEDSIERKIPTGFIATVAAAETGNIEFKGAPTATIIAGQIKMKDGKILGDPEGKPLIFEN